jgi:glycosyltransferase involved in cell wall biosynthesis
MAKKILMGCYAEPCHAGANTSAYRLFKMMQGDGLDVHYVNLIDERDADYYRYIFGNNFDNPQCLDGVYNCVLTGCLFNQHPELADLIEQISPDISIGVEYIAALLMKRAAPQTNLLFIASGCKQVKTHIEKKKARDAISLIESMRRTTGVPVILDNYESQAVVNSDFVITVSDMIKFFYQHFYPFQIGKIYTDVVWCIDWAYKGAQDFLRLNRSFSKREIDIIFVASAWNRAEENYRFVKEMVSQFKGLNIHIVGEVEKRIPYAKHHRLMTKLEDLFALLGNTKTVVCASLFDGSPGILFEASAMGCNIVASRNCGNWQICNEGLLVDPFNLDNFVDKIPLSLRQKYDDNIEIFLKTNSYKNLIDTILVF